MNAEPTAVPPLRLLQRPVRQLPVARAPVPQGWWARWLFGAR